MGEPELSHNSTQPAFKPRPTDGMPRVVISGRTPRSSDARGWCCQRGCRKVDEVGPEATIDSLTGLANRRAFYDALSFEHEATIRHGRSAWLLVADLDGFKLINDRYGHAAGDEALVEVAGRLLQIVGRRGLVCRFGGEEFAVLLYAPIDEATAAGFAAALAEVVCAEPVEMNGQLVDLEISVGSAALDSSNGPEEALRQADERLYHAKRRAGGDPFDRVSELVVGLLSAGAEGVERALAAGVAEVARAETVFVCYPDGEQWWPDLRIDDRGSLMRDLAALAMQRDELVQENRWLLAVPLAGEHGPMGAFAVSREDAFGKADRIALVRVGVALGQALLRLQESAEARRRLRELEDLAFRDENTGVANRRALLAELERRSGDAGPLSLLFLDFDGLRTVNNQLSYEHGNELLRTVAAAIERSIGARRVGRSAARIRRRRVRDPLPRHRRQRSVTAHPAARTAVADSRASAADPGTVRRRLRRVRGKDRRRAATRPGQPGSSIDARAQATPTNTAGRLTVYQPGERLRRRGVGRVATMATLECLGCVECGCTVQNGSTAGGRTWANPTAHLLRLAMQKVVGSSPIIRSHRSPAQAGYFFAPRAWRIAREERKSGSSQVR